MLGIDLLLGSLLILAGRELFWLCVGIAGFLAGMNYALSLGIHDSVAITYIVAVAVGTVGAVLAITFKWVMVVFVLGFLGGGYLLTATAPYLMAGFEQYTWQIFAAGGVLGAVLVMITFDWALIIISSFIGASLIVQALPMPNQAWQAVLFIAAVFTGLAVQSMTINRPSGKEKNRRRPHVAQE